MTPKQDLIIIGAGLSGLYAATLLHDKFNITILEARDRLGGRVLTKEGHDLGPSWIWPHQNNILKLIHQYNLELFTQYTKGDALYDAPGAVQRFQSPPSAPSARVVGGLQTLIEALASTLSSDMIHFHEEVTKISCSTQKIRVDTLHAQYEADYVVSTLAPRLACENIDYEPPLDEDVYSKMLQTPTWMGHTAKCVVEFQEAFWKGEGLSGFVFSHIGPLGEIHDASTKNKAALFGFLHPKASVHDIEARVKEQMKRLFADKSELITKIYCTDWKEERFSSTKHDHAGLSEHPSYGLKLSHCNGRLFFIGTETAYDNGGYLEGAVISAKSLANTLHQEHITDF
jgi:monoamine oxidase